MKAYRTLYFISALLTYIIPLTAIAGWQVSQPSTTIPKEPFFQTGVQRKAIFVPSSHSSSVAVFPNQYARLGQPAAHFAVSISGSLKENMERILGRYHWKVIWKAPFDYNFDGRVSGSSLQNVIQKLLDPFPLQAQMYMSNRIVAIVSRDYKDKTKC